MWAWEEAFRRRSYKGTAYGRRHFTYGRVSPPLRLAESNTEFMHRDSFSFWSWDCGGRVCAFQKFPAICIWLKLAMSLPAEKIAQLKSFVELCKVNPSILHLPDLQFFRDWLER